MEARPYRQRARARATARTAAAIDAAASRELALRGYAGMRVAAVAKRAGVAPRTVYLHAPTKEALAERALRRRADAFARRVSRWRPRASAPDAVLEELVGVHSRNYRGEKQLLETLVDGGLPRGAAVLLRDLDGVRLDIITRTMMELSRRGALAIRPGDAIALAHALLAYPTWRIALTGPAGRRAQRLIATALRAALLS